MSAEDSVCRLVDGQVQCGPKFCYSIDLDERGVFRASVSDAKDKTVFSIHIDDADEDADSSDSNIFEDGFMKHPNDIAGLEEYLKSLGVIPKNGALLTAENCEQIRIAKEIDAGRKAKRATALKMSSQDRFDLGYTALFGR